MTPPMITKRLPDAMAFYHEDGLSAAWKQAMRFAGKDGRLATMPDIVAARLETKPGALPWETYFTTLTAEYYGFSKTGKRVLIIAHGVGPMSTLQGVQKAYSWQYNDKDRNRRGGRITAQEFLDLEAGKFGEVSIVDLESYCTQYEYAFAETLRSSDALTDPVLKARVIREGLQAYLDDANQAWIMGSEGAYEPPAPRRGKARVVQEELLRTLVPVT